MLAILYKYTSYSLLLFPFDFILVAHFSFFVLTYSSCLILCLRCSLLRLYPVVALEFFVNGVMQKFKHKFFIGGLMGSNIFLLWVQFLKKKYITLNFYFLLNIFQRLMGSAGPISMYVAPPMWTWVMESFLVYGS